MEQIIKMWRTINYLTRSQTTQNLQKIDIPEDYFIKWNHINSHKGFKLKTIDDTELIDTYIAERNVYNLHHAYGSPFPSNHSNY